MPKQKSKPNPQLEQLEIDSIIPVVPQKNNNDRKGSWLTVSYKPVSLFSLKRSDATSMAAKTNLVPTPFCIKMTLLKILIESGGKANQANFGQWIDKQFQWIRSLQIYILPPESLVVNRNGYKLRYFDQIASKSEQGKASPVLPMQDGFVFREWIHFDGELEICCGSLDRQVDLSVLENLLSQINCLGKRGCFFQYLPQKTLKEIDLPNRFQSMDNLAKGFTLQSMDDMGEQATFNRINPFSDEPAKLGRDRVIKTGLLPLWLAETSTRYDYYKRL